MSPIVPTTPDLLAVRFWAKVDVRGPDECWPWRGANSGERGYGQMTVLGRRRLAHRVAWELAGGAIPPGLFVLHRCDNPPCCNARHLFLGTQAANMQDARSKGRTLTRTRSRPTASAGTP